MSFAGQTPTTTSIDLENERLLTLAGAARYLSKKMPDRWGGKPCHISSVYRWTARGVKGVRLETLQVVGAKMTSVEAIGRFVARLSGNAPGSSETTPAKLAAAGRKRLAEADRQLDAAGIR